MTSSEIRFQQIFESGRYSGLSQLSDGRIYTEDGCAFDVHKVILACNSDFFRAMFCGIDKNKKEYEILNINGESMNEILSYIYTKNIYVTDTNLKDLLIASDYLLIKDLYLKLKLQVKNKITHANCLKLCHAAYKLNEKDMFQFCLKFIYERFGEIIKNQKDDLLDLPLEILKRILSCRNLNVESEHTVWKVIVYWTQACVESRFKYVQILLSTLAVDEIDRNLATEIVNHDIVHSNPSIKSLFCLQSFNCFNNDSDFLRSILLKISNGTQLQKFRIPKKLNIVSKYSEECNEEGIFIPYGEIYISYDETLSLFRKITHINFEPEYIITAGSNLYIFEKMGSRCTKFNLNTMQQESMINFRYFGQTILGIGNCIYSLYQNMNGAYNIEVYNTDDSKYFFIQSFSNVCHASAAAVGENILFVGLKPNLDGMVAVLFNPVTQQWNFLSPPRIFRSHFELVPYHGKIYLLGGFDANNEVLWEIEVYDPETDFWKEIPRLPFDYPWVAAIVLNDQMIIYDLASMLGREKFASTFVKWNDILECWENLNNSILPEKFCQYRFCTVSDIETIKFQTNINRNAKTNLEKSSFISL